MNEVYVAESETAIFDLYFAGLCHIKHHPRNVPSAESLPLDVYEGLAVEAYKMLLVRRHVLGATADSELTEPSQEPLPAAPAPSPQ